jgi:hypothetical protein
MVELLKVKLHLAFSELLQNEGPKQWAAWSELPLRHPHPPPVCGMEGWIWEGLSGVVPAG